MLYKMHLSPDEVEVIDKAMRDHLTLLDMDAPKETAERAARKVTLLKEYVDLCGRVRETILERDKAKTEYNVFTFNEKGTQ